MSLVQGNFPTIDPQKYRHIGDGIISPFNPSNLVVGAEVQNSIHGKYDT